MLLRTLLHADGSPDVTVGRLARPVYIVPLQPFKTRLPPQGRGYLAAIRQREAAIGCYAQQFARGALSSGMNVSGASTGAAGGNTEMSRWISASSSLTQTDAG